MAIHAKIESRVPKLVPDQIPSPGRPTRCASNPLYGIPSKISRETGSPRTISHGPRLIRKERLYTGQKRSSACSVDPFQAHRSRKSPEPLGSGNITDEDTPLLACPFAKLDGSRYYECLKFKLHRVRDVKQHIARRHMGPEFYCARCWQTFPNRSEQDEHTRTAVCSKKPKPLFEGVSDYQKQQLARNSLRGATPEQQWHRIWEILFPGKLKPSSIYLGNFMEETLSHIGKRCQNADWSTLLAALRKRHRSRVDEELVRDIVMVALDWFPTIIDNTSADCEPAMAETEEFSSSGQISPCVSTPTLDPFPSALSYEPPFGGFSSSNGTYDFQNEDWGNMETLGLNWDQLFEDNAMVS